MLRSARLVQPVTSALNSLKQDALLKQKVQTTIVLEEIASQISNTAQMVLTTTKMHPRQQVTVGLAHQATTASQQALLETEHNPQ